MHSLTYMNEGIIPVIKQDIVLVWGRTTVDGKKVDIPEPIAYVIPSFLPSLQKVLLGSHSDFRLKDEIFAFELAGVHHLSKCYRKLKFGSSIHAATQYIIIYYNIGYNIGR